MMIRDKSIDTICPSSMYLCNIITGFATRQIVFNANPNFVVSLQMFPHSAFPQNVYFKVIEFFFVILYFLLLHAEYVIENPFSLIVIIENQRRIFSFWLSLTPVPLACKCD